MNYFGFLVDMLYGTLRTTRDKPLLDEELQCSLAGGSFQVGRRTQRPVVHTRNNYFLKELFSENRSFFFFFFIKQRKTSPLVYSLSYVMHRIEKKRDNSYHAHV